MFRCITAKKNKQKENSNEHEYKKYQRKKTVTHITNHIFINYWVTIYSVQK